MPISNPKGLTVREFLKSAGIVVLAGEIVMAGSSEAAEIVTLDTATRDYKMPDQIPWPKPGNSGTQTVTLVGDPRKPGFYLQRLRRPPNNWSGPHKHDHTRYITVLEGTMWIGTGDSFDKDKTVGLKPGSFCIDYAEHTHYDGSKEDGLTIQISGIVPADHQPGRG